MGVTFTNTGTIDRVYTMRIYRSGVLIHEKGFTVNAAMQYGTYVVVFSGGSGSTTFDVQLVTTSNNEYVADRSLFVQGRKR